MGASINNFDKYMNGDAEIQAFTTDKLSNAVVRIMDRIASDEDIFKLLYFEDEKSLSYNLNNLPEAKKVFDKKHIVKNGSDSQRVKPYPFNSIAQEKHQCFIRIYFNQGSIDKSGFIAKNQINIDIIVSQGLWLTSDPSKRLWLVRPYAIMSRLIDILESERMDRLPKPTGYSHLTVNEKFECIRIYANLTSTEKENLEEI